MTQPPAGWYPDPTPQQPGQQMQVRYWDGHAWTQHVQPAGPQPSQQPSPDAGQYGGQYGEVAYAGPTTPDGVPLSGWWRRVGAFIIDSILVSVVVNILTSIVTVSMQADVQDKMEDLVQRLDEETAANPDAVPDLGAFFGDMLEIITPLLILSAITGFVVWALYSGLMLRFKGATVGKMALGIAVRLRDRPGQLPWSTIAVRVLVQFWLYLTAVVPYLYFALFWWPALDVLWAAWDSKRQALHDKAARTNVVRVR